MKVLKFGGSSVANAENINRVVGIVENTIANEKCILIVSAFSGVTDTLIECGQLASAGDEQYKEKLSGIEHRHLEAARLLIPVAQQSSILSWVKKRCNELEDICNGVFLLGELSPRTKDRIVSYGELISSYLIAARFRVAGTENTWKDAKELITTDSNFTYAAVDFAVTNEKIRKYFSGETENLYVVPGFVASDAHGVITTLGRGGSDYTAAILAAGVQAQL